MRYDDKGKNNRGGESYGADGKKRSDYSEHGMPPEYNDESNEIIIGGSGDDADYDVYSRRLERRAAKPARRPKIEYEDDGYPSRRDRKRAMRQNRARADIPADDIADDFVIGAEDAVEEASAAAAETAKETSSAVEKAAEEAVSAAEEAVTATEEAVSAAEEAAEEAVTASKKAVTAASDHTDNVLSDLLGGAGSHPVIERIEDSAEAAGEDVIEVIAEKAEDAADRLEAVKDAVSDKLGDIREAVSDKSADIKEAITDRLDGAKEKAKEKAEEIKDAVSERAGRAKEKAAEIKEDIVEAVTDLTEPELPEVPDEDIPPSDSFGEEISEQVEAIKEEISGQAAQFKKEISRETVKAARDTAKAGRIAKGSAVITAAAASAASAAGKAPSRVERLDGERDILDELLGDDEYYDEPVEEGSEGYAEEQPLEAAAAAETGEEEPEEEYPAEEESVEEYPDEEEPEEEYPCEEEPEEDYPGEEEPEEEYPGEEEPEEEYPGEEEPEEEYPAEEEPEEEIPEEEYSGDEAEEEPAGDEYGYDEEEYEEEEEPEVYSGSDGYELDEGGLPLPLVKPRDLEAVRRRREAAGEKAPAKARKHDLLVSASPHIHCGETTRVLMGDVIIALIPALIASVLWFGWRALMITGVCVASSVITEFFCRRIMKRRQTVGDLSAVVTGMLLAFCLPPEINPVFAVIGSVVAIAVVKQMFGGIGMNFANPAATARIVLMLSFPVAMTTWSRPFYYYLDAISEATPLSKLAEGGGELPTYAELLVGYHSGCIGETCAVALLLGGLYLLLRGVISWEIPISFMGTVALFSLAAGQDPVYQLLSGGVVLGAVFMATDYVTSPVNSKGRLIFGCGCGLLTMLIRLYGNMPEGVSFAILLMNIITPHIDRLTLSVPFGEEREAA